MPNKPKSTNKSVVKRVPVKRVSPSKRGEGSTNTTATAMNKKRKENLLYSHPYSNESTISSAARYTAMAKASKKKTTIKRKLNTNHLP